jgi:adenylate cyclase
MFNRLNLHKFRFPLFWQMLLAMSLLLCLTTLSLWGYLQFNLTQLLQEQTDTFANTISQQAADSAAEMVMADDQLALASMLDNLVSKTKNIHSITLYNHEQKLLAQAQGSNNSKQVRSYQADILFHDVLAGKIVLSLDISPISDSLIATQKALGFICMGIGLLALILAIAMARKLTRPLKQLQQVVRVVAEGQLNPTLPPSNNDEVGDLVHDFSHMLQGLRDKESIENKFSSYISKDIAKDILSDLHVSKKPLRSVTGSVLFVDIVGFTQLCENQSPQHIADILNQYYFLLHQAAKMYRGSVDSYIGDGAMLTFGVHKEDQKHAINAICGAQIFIRLCDLMNDQRKQKQLAPLQFRLGLHCGTMLAGTIGSSERMQFTISGDTVNVAARLCDLADPGKLLISNNVYQHHSAQQLVITEPAQSLQVKGKANAIKCFNITRLAPKFNRLLMQQEAELKAMHANE